jgi:hypothetical protein
MYTERVWTDFCTFQKHLNKKFLAYIGKLKITLFWLSLVRRPGTSLTRNLGWFNQTVKSCLEFYTMHDLAILELNSEFCTISDHLKVATFKWYVLAIPVQRSNQLGYRGQLSSPNRKFMYRAWQLANRRAACVIPARGPNKYRPNKCINIQTRNSMYKICTIVRPYSTLHTYKRVGGGCRSPVKRILPNRATAWFFNTVL